MTTPPASDGDFYEDDEPIEKVREDWRRGEPGLTTGPRHLDQRDREAVEALEWTLEDLLDRAEHGVPIEGARTEPTEPNRGTFAERMDRLVKDRTRDV